jgi:3'(2'), 5'-bisphosphate nucleotidase
MTRLHLSPSHAVSPVTGPAPDLPSLMDAAIDAALAAGREILTVYEAGFTVQEKEDRSPLTEADRRAHTAIAQHLAATDLPLLSEEGRTIAADERQAWHRYWLVDPLDGTKEFIKRNGEFTVNIALVQDTVAVLGALYVPVKDVLYFAWPGGGAWRQEHAATHGAMSAYERAARSVRLPMPRSRDTYTIVASRSHQSAETDAFIRQAEQQHGKVELTSMGSALKICLVAEGAADVYPRYAPTMEWDTAAGHAICVEAGRELFDVITNAPMRYNKNELVNNWFIVQ